MQDQLPDHKHGAIRIPIEDVRNALATSTLNRHWTVYETANAFVTSDEPVVMVAGGHHTYVRRSAVPSRGQF